MSNKAKIREDAMRMNPIDDARFPKTSARKRSFKTTEKGVGEMCEQGNITDAILYY